MGIALVLFGVFGFVWFLFFNRFAILYYQEQIQLFRFEKLYFLSFLDRPGGFSEYMGAFLTQFYFYPLAGAFILTTILITVVLLFHYICKSCGNIRKMFFISFIPAVLLMTSFANVFFDMSAALGILIVLAGFNWYIRTSFSIRYGAGIIMVTAIYFIAAGNALLLTVLILICELTDKRTPMTRITQIYADNTNNRNLSFSDNEQYKNPRKSALSASFAFKALYLLLLTSWAALLPWLSWRFLYTVTMHEAYFAITPATFFKPTIDILLLWLSIPVLYLVWRIIVLKCHCGLDPQSPNSRGYCVKRNMTARIHILNYLLVAVMTAYCTKSLYNLRSNIINRMTFELQNSNYDSVLAIGRNNPTNNRLVCYLTNIALYESGQMPYRMFYYKQMGTAGLFLNWEYANSSTLVWYLGEVYYRLGMILQAEHCAFESFVSSHKGLDAKVLQRLALTNIALRDSATADKYLQYLDHSLFYSEWSQQQHVNLSKAMADSTFHIPGMPIPVHSKDFFIPYQMPEYTMLMLLDSNPKHRMAFEYLMAYCMLERDLKKVKWCMDNYYRNFDFSEIPTHYEEAMLLYKNVYGIGPEFFSQYPISNATLERYDRYMQAVQAAKVSKRKFEQFQKQFGNTFWYYMNLIDPASLKK